MKQLYWLKEEESGQGVVEYALILAGIALVVLLAVFALGQQIATFFTGVGEKVTELSG
jgi:pilus assembly protein Flp/PilA